MITITHTPAEGTLINGSSKGDGVLELLRGLRDNWRWFPSLRKIGIGQSRDRIADRGKVERAAQALRAAGHEVEVCIDNGDARDFADAEQGRYDRAEDRADRHAEAGARASDRSEARHAAAHAIVDGYPMGQPVLVGHHSEGRHRRDLERADGHMRASAEEARKARYHAGREQAAEQYRASREDVPTTLRRIERLEAEDRQAERRLTGEGTMSGRPAEGEYRDDLLARREMLAGELAYWREHVAAREAEGVKVWGRDDFARGDWVRDQGGRWHPVARVNAKSLTVPHWLIDGQTMTLPYSKVTGRKAAGEDSKAGK